jgi:hypothetical protein
MFFRAGARLTVFEVIFLAIDEQDNVSVLLDRPRFAKIRELWALVIALFDLA